MPRRTFCRDESCTPERRGIPIPRNQNFGGQSMVGPLARLILCPPEAGGWFDPARAERWQEQGYRRQPEPAAAQAQFAVLRRILDSLGAEVVCLPASEEFSLDAVFVHDPSLITDAGAVSLRMGKPCREAEPQHHARLYRALGIPLLGEIRPPGKVEAGDLVWLDPATLLAGRGYRTNAAGIEQLRALLAPLNVAVLSAPLPHAAGPGACLHLMSLLSLLDDRTALVDLPWLSVETVELLEERRFKLVEIEASERESLACNVLALGEGRLLAFEENAKTNARLRNLGFDVRTFPGSEIGINAGGGPTCLTRPIRRG